MSVAKEPTNKTKEPARKTWKFNRFYDTTYGHMVGQGTDVLRVV